MPCSPLRMSRRCRPQGPEPGVLPPSTGNYLPGSRDPFSVGPALNGPARTPIDDLGRMTQTTWINYGPDGKYPV
jgi:hypothetical protein